MNFRFKKISCGPAISKLCTFVCVTLIGLGGSLAKAQDYRTNSSGMVRAAQPPVSYWLSDQSAQPPAQLVSHAARPFQSEAPNDSSPSLDAAACESCDSCRGCGSCRGGCGHCRGGSADDWCSREKLFGDWFGARSCLADHGIVANIYQLNFYQGVAAGGVEQDFKYGGKLHYEFTFEGAKLGLNKGFDVFMHAERRFGEGIGADAGLLTFPNTEMLYPIPENGIGISGLFFIQELNERFSFTAGKFRTLDLFNMIYPEAHVRGQDGFMNFQMLLPPTLLRTTGLSINALGLLAMKGENVQGGLVAYDTQNSSTTVAPDLFANGAEVLGYYRFFTNFGGKPGTQGFLGNWSSRKYTSLDPLSYGPIPGEGLAAPQETGAWSLTYFLDQQVWADRCNEKRNIRLFSIWSGADPDASPWRFTANASLQGSGLIRGREADNMGIGYFYSELNTGFKDLVNASPVLDIQNVHGGEFYYNMAITPWFHLTTDLQVIDNENVSNNTAVVFGIRGKIDL